MKHTLLHTSFLLFFTLFFSGCFSSTLNISAYKEKVFQKEVLAPVCKVLLLKDLERVAVVNFTNNTSYGKAKSNNKSSSFGFGIGLSPTFAGIGGKTKKTSTKRFVDPKLSSALVPLIEDLLLKAGGNELFTREDASKVDAELQLQDSGLLDPSSIVEFGKSSGVQYLVTGSLNYVRVHMSHFSGASQAVHDITKDSKNDELKVFGAALRVLTSFTDGTNIETSLSIKIIDVASGAIKFTHTLKGEADLGHNSQPSYGEIIGGIKKSFAQELPFLQKKFSQYFSASTYIKQLRKNEEEVIAQIAYGSNQDIKSGDLFQVYRLEENTDPLNNKKSCDIIRLNLILEASKEIQNNSSWLKIKEGQSKNLKLLQIVKKIQ